MINPYTEHETPPDTSNGLIDPDHIFGALLIKKTLIRLCHEYNLKIEFRTAVSEKQMFQDYIDYGVVIQTNGKYHLHESVDTLEAWLDL